jgi:hypothetical protein
VLAQAATVVSYACKIFTSLGPDLTKRHCLLRVILTTTRITKKKTEAAAS